MNKKEKFALYLPPEKKAEIERRYQADGCRSATAFVEKAVDFYMDYLDASDAGLCLPQSIKSYLDGRLGKMEDLLAALSFKHSVKVDMMAGILADGFQFAEDDLRRRRAESVSNVKRTNGRISFEKRARESWEEGNDEWQGIPQRKSRGKGYQPSYGMVYPVSRSRKPIRPIYAGQDLSYRPRDPIRQRASNLLVEQVSGSGQRVRTVLPGSSK